MRIAALQRILVSLLAAVPAFVSAQVFAATSVVGYELVSKTISGRTTVDYTYRIKVQNTTPALVSAGATVVSGSPATIIVDGEVTLGALPANSQSTSADTFTMRQDRLKPFDASALAWTVNGSVLVPPVVGLAKAAATDTIAAAGLVLGAVSDAHSANVAAGLVISQNPSANSTVPLGDAVSLVVSLGPVPNGVPTANAGPDQTVKVGTQVALNGTGSSDPDNDALSFSWSLVGSPSGSAATLAGSSTATPSFTPDVAGEYKVQLVVNDGKASSAPDEVNVTAEASDEIGKLIQFTPPPLPDGPAVAAGLPQDSSGRPVLFEIPGEASLRLVPQAARPARVVVSCTRWITTCHEPSAGRSLDDCARSAPVCKTQQPWTEAGACCPQACYDQYKARRLSGDGAKKALMDVYATGACFPAVNE